MMEAAMSMNEDRANWAEAATVAFASLTSLGDVSDETVTDLISDLGHFARLRLGLQYREIIRLFENGIEAWVSETGRPDNDALEGRVVTISID
jgi:hypothetical protein